jgi:hypothetical protein
VKVKILLAILFIGLSLPVFAGEREELQLKQAYLQERAGRLQAEFIITQDQLKEVNATIKAFKDKPKQEVK